MGLEDVVAAGSGDAEEVAWVGNDVGEVARHAATAIERRQDRIIAAEHVLPEADFAIGREAAAVETAQRHGVAGDRGIEGAERASVSEIQGDGRYGRRIDELSRYNVSGRRIPREETGT